MNTIYRASELKTGESAVISEVSLDATTDPRLGEDCIRRLLELGFIPGESVKVIRKGFPYGDPIAFRIGTSTFALRAKEAQTIKVGLPQS
ncbi:MAG: ferrous iron transport protein A [Ferrovum sp. 37-45-19]|uniref:FeoA family protein n=1 Tax=Ferrovum sp. JA12 TaxID=1356299 RepID=UPI00070258AB|nr:FeoA family protein [Ferrovum sp. JA12]OYV80639.1 MAG: ferrous iron transport protein A [Ferrovum sp. 21-44-67]OYV95190.1 MAG: ferrous iron transport protein A [Ferrovum sp. 37-45-19]HQT80689.1 FeoA family protein [Ferrovaceae bacterium]KRH79781.1 ferrous iron transport protein A [Ferrovum sp. JA12]HQU05899.1 FeoA family protein [Ferrovaceae bacterium]